MFVNLDLASGYPLNILVLCFCNHKLTRRPRKSGRFGRGEDSHISSFCATAFIKGKHDWIPFFKLILIIGKSKKGW